MQAYLKESDDIRREIAIARNMIRQCDQKLDSLNEAWENGSLKESLLAHDILSAREFQVFALVRVGLTNSKIGAELFLNERTIESHLESILKKLNCRNRTELLQVK